MDPIPARHRGKRTPFDVDGWFDTGDLGWIDGAGRLHVTGRSDDLIVSGGENVDPTEVERAVAVARPEIAEACVFGLPDPRWGEVVAAALVLKETAEETTEADLAADLAATLAPHRVPRRLFYLDRLPQRGGGEVDRAAVAAICQNKGG